ncbi:MULTISPECIES: hypothetical protein [Psychrobacter]|uniref:Uncharacterized protein n=1 Tax=Psychrobacter fozii TaxID=198480 RepID=A0A2V4UHQ6_9GAMM|nr:MULTISPECIES: hypothetical protein [Psychrobacter]MDN3453255.1 hypothetical protein [Psychrobacter sp. APC 3350]MDN3503487.1 hypothetical protein [Psychrobacter sp. 5A.1]PYE39733.1 hypothetical protein DFP82_103181 [Psychrobacter fozii]
MMNMNDMLGAVTGGDNDENGLSGLIDSAKNISSEDIQRYQSMSKAELLDEIKNSEHSAAVVAFIKDLIAKKFNG